MKVRGRAPSDVPSGNAGPSEDAVELLYEEAKGRVEILSDAISEIDDRIQGIVRFNVLVLGLFVPGLSVLLRGGNENPFDEGQAIIPLAVGFGSLVVSTTIAVSAYLKKGTTGGVDADRLAGALSYDVTLVELREELVRTYRVAAATQEELLEQTARRFRASLIVLIGGLLSLLVSAITLWVEGGG